MIWKPILALALMAMPSAVSAQIIVKATEPRAEASWLSDADYPEGVIRRTDAGTVRALLTIGIDGRVSDCKIVRSSGAAILDETTCRLVKRRARFHPAIDADGKPVPDVYLYSRTWTSD